MGGDDEAGSGKGEVGGEKGEDGGEKNEGVTEGDEIVMPADTMRERTDESRLKMWLLIGANRAIVTALVLVATFALLVVFEVLGPTDLAKLSETDAVGATFTSIIIAVVTSVTLVLTVAQLVLSQEIGPLGEKSDQLQREVEFRKNVEDEADVGISPTEPSAFLRTLVDLADDRAEGLKEAVSNSADAEGTSAVTTYAEAVSDHSESVRAELEDAEFGTFDVLLPVLNYNYAWKIFAARSLQNRYGGNFDGAVDEQLDELLDVLRFFAPAREYFKALYFQWEIINVARETLFGVIPALALSGYMILSFDAGGISGTTLGVRNQYLFVSAVYTAAFTPFAVLLAYILRILTVIKRTLSLGPFILREGKHHGDIRFDD